MIDYSIESSVERIDNPQTKKYFQEVLSSYQIGNYRSAVVMLWSIVICDLIYKLQYLRDVDSDLVAQDILDEIEIKQKANPNSPDWEIHLLKTVKEKTELLDTSDFTNLNSIQQIRHLSAHPVLGNTDLLFTPHKEQVRSYIRIALESILTKPPVFLRKVVDEFVVDIASKKEILIDEVSLKRYIESKYFKRLRPNTENHLFRALWKFVFFLENDETNENRNINYRCLRIILGRRSTEIKSYILEHKDFFSKLGSETTLTYLVDLLGDYPDLFYLLDDSAKILIENHSKSNLGNFAGAFFLSDSIEVHLKNIIERIESMASIFPARENKITQKVWEKILLFGHENECNTLVKEIAIKMYIKSTDFDSGNLFFKRYIEPIMSQFNESEIVSIINGVEFNSQAYGRRQAKIDHQRLMDVCEKLLPIGFDESEYPQFFSYKKNKKRIVEEEIEIVD